MARRRNREAYSDIMGTVRRTLERLEAAVESGALAELCRNHSVELLVLFGSAASSQGSASARDVDLALAFRPGEEGDLLGVIDALGTLAGSDALDVMDLDSAGPVAMHRALTGGRALYAESPQALTERQIFAINHYIETAPLRRAVLESLTR